MEFRLLERELGKSHKARGIGTARAEEEEEEEEEEEQEEFLSVQGAWQEWAEKTKLWTSIATAAVAIP